MDKDNVENLEIGTHFYTYEEADLAVKTFAKENYMVLWKRDARTIKSSKVQRFISEKLIYYELKYTCLHGGKEFSTSSKGVRESSTYRNKCPFHIRLRASKDGHSLEVVAFKNEHNHELTKEQYSHYPLERKLPKDISDTARDLLRNKKIDKQKYNEETDEIILLRDLANVASINDDKKNNLLHCFEMIRQKYDCEVTVLEDTESNFQGLFAQTPSMKRIFQYFPEFLAVDASHKFLNMGVPFYLLLVEDGNCCCQIVGMCLLVSESDEYVSWLLQTFKDSNPSSSDIKCIIMDKDMEEDVIKSIFPEVTLISCVFNTMRRFQDDIKCEKMKISNTQKNNCVEVLRKLLYAKSEEVFSQKLESFVKVAPEVVQDYYFKNWHESRNEWSMCGDFCKFNFLDDMGNKLESMKGKLRTAVGRNSSLEDFLIDFFKMASTMMTEREHRAGYNELKQPVVIFEEGSPELQYTHLLTKEPAKQLIRQIENSNQVVLILQQNDSYLIRLTSEDSVTTNIDTCSCSYFNCTFLPCRHIFTLRKHLDLPLFDEKLINRRWTKSYNRRHNESGAYGNKPKNAKAFGQRKREVLPISDSIVDLAAQSSNETFERRKQLLLRLKEMWEDDIDVEIVPMSSKKQDLIVGVSPEMCESMNF